MIRVAPVDEPTDFDELVRQPGLKALPGFKARRAAWELKAPPRGRKPKLKRCWSECKDDLHREYGGVCAYCAFYIGAIEGEATVDHFVASSTDLDLAYEWSNYRLASMTINRLKLDFDDVIDPFEVEDGWFEIDFILLEVVPGKQLQPQVSERVRATIERLELWTGDYQSSLLKWWNEWNTGAVTGDFIERNAPFLYREAVRQNMAPGAL